MATKAELKDEIARLETCVNDYDADCDELVGYLTDAAARNNKLENEKGELEQERDRLLLQLSQQVRITETFADRAEAWHKEYWNLRNEARNTETPQ